jgi:hypothetical protein
MSVYKFFFSNLYILEHIHSYIFTFSLTGNFPNFKITLRIFKGHVHSPHSDTLCNASRILLHFDNCIPPLGHPYRILRVPQLHLHDHSNIPKSQAAKCSVSHPPRETMSIWDGCIKHSNYSSHMALQIGIYIIVLWHS